VSLATLFAEAAARWPQRTAVVDTDGNRLSYRELDGLVGAAANACVGAGVRAGDRVGVYVHKSAESVAAILGTLRCGAAYVPVDPDGPVDRNAFILSDCATKVVFAEPVNRDRLRSLQPNLQRCLS